MSSKLEKFGLKSGDSDFFYKLLSEIDSVEKAIMYSLRSTGDFEMAANIEIAISGKKINEFVMQQIIDSIKTKGPTTVWFDIVNFDDINDEIIKEYIDDNGIIIYNSTEENNDSFNVF